MKYGLENKFVVVKMYLELIGNNVYLCGFVINLSILYFGVFLDRKVFDFNFIF